MKLSKRLQTIASLLDKHSEDLLDIGYDHGFLLQWAAVRGIKRLGGVETKLDFQQRFENRFGKSEIQFYVGSGFEAVADEPYRTVVIAGLGEERIRSLLTSAPTDQIAACEHLIFCPSSTDLQLRDYLNHHGWAMQHEEIVEERGRLYVISHAMRGLETETESKRRQIGPRLFDKSDPLLKRYLQANYQRFQYAL